MKETNFLKGFMKKSSIISAMFISSALSQSALGNILVTSNNKNDADIFSDSPLNPALVDKISQSSHIERIEILKDVLESQCAKGSENLVLSEYHKLIIESEVERIDSMEDTESTQAIIEILTGSRIFDITSTDPTKGG